MSCMDDATVDSFYNTALYPCESSWIDALLDRVLPLNLLDTNSVTDPSKAECTKTLYTLISAKHFSWESFASSVQQYDNSITCGLVWTKNYYAYRCRTCAISQCMSLCEECFKAGNHEGHDFNLFRSSSGGACDCGDCDVMKETGFCHRHGERNATKMPSAPPELVATARVVAPRLLLLLVMHLRRNCTDNTDASMPGVEWLLAILKNLAGLGAAMLTVLCSAVSDERLYADTLVDWRARRAYAGVENDAEFAALDEAYRTALGQLPSVLPEDGSVELGGVRILERLRHRSLLEELTFWTARAKFPQQLIGLLLSMLPTRGYKAPFAAAFAGHYLRMVSVLCSSGRPVSAGAANSYQANLSYRVVHISVQLLSASGLCQHMCAEHALLERVLIGLDYVLASSGGGGGGSRGDDIYRPAGTIASPEPCRVDHPIMMEHRYWPVVSDLVNMLVHRPVALRLLQSDCLLSHYTALLGRLHLANPNLRATRLAVELDSSKVYYSAFAADNEIAACTLWTLWAWARPEPDLSSRVLRLACDAVRRLDNAYLPDRLSFHLPVHRLASAFLCASAAVVGDDCEDQLRSLFSPLESFLNPPLRSLVGYCEVSADLWLRNGLQMKGQAMTYVHSSFCCSLVDLDMHLTQAALAAMPDKADAVRLLFRLLHMEEYLLPQLGASENDFIGPGNSDRAAGMAEWGLQLIAWLLCLCPAAQMAVDEAAQLERELTVAICVEDRSHSQLVDCLPDRESAHHEPGRHSAMLPALSHLADLSPSSTSAAAAEMSPPVYRPRPEVWLDRYDPLMTGLRCAHRRHHQAGMDRYARYLASSGLGSQERQQHRRRDYQAWPPYRLPGCASQPLMPKHLASVTDLLHTSAMHAALFGLLYKFVHNQPVRSGTISLAVFLLELALTVPRRETDTSKFSCDDARDLGFTSHDLAVNLVREVPTESGPTCLLALLLGAHRQLSGGANPTLADLAGCRVTRDRRVGEGRDFLCRVISLACPQGSAAREWLRREIGDCGLGTSPVSAAAAAGPQAGSGAVEERKRKLMERMVAQQRAFAANLVQDRAADGDADSDMAAPGASAAGSGVECCICQKSGSDPGSDESPFALLALAQTSSILGHRTCPTGRRLWSLLEDSHWSEALTELRWGVVVTSCGHAVHSACVQPYISGMDHARVFPCPLCRQSFNLVLPSCPGLTWEGPPSPLPLRSRWEFCGGARGVSDSLATPVQTASGQLLSLAQLWSPAPDPAADEERWSFWAGILLTNLRLELCLMDTAQVLHTRYLARCCTGHLLRFLMEKSAYELQRRESSAFLTAFLDHFMAGAPAPEGMPFQPLLLQDPGKMLVLLVLTAVWKKQQWFAALAAAYNLAYVQSLLAELLSASPQERLAWQLHPPGDCPMTEAASEESQDQQRPEPLVEHVRILLCHADPALRQSARQQQQQQLPEQPPRLLSDLRAALERRLLPLLRLAALLLGHVTRDSSSASAAATAAGQQAPQPHTFARLCDRLGLCPADPSRLFTPLDAGLDRLAPAWLASPAAGAAGLLDRGLVDRLSALSAELRPPRLASLPASYDSLFSAFRARSCRHCGAPPPHPALCLVCEEFLCFNSPCCATRLGEDSVGECHRHSMLCGSGVCLLLAIDSSYVWVFTHGQAVRWGSLYLDEFGEEDEELRRGRPLYLSRQRYELLESQWLLHNYYSSGVSRLAWPSHSL